AGTAQQVADARKDSWIFLQLEITLPLLARGGELDQVRGKETFGVRAHGAQLPHADCTAGLASADLIEKGRTTVDDFDPKRSGHQDGSSRESERDSQTKVDAPLQPAIERDEKILSYFEAQRASYFPARNPKSREPEEVRNHRHAAEGGAPPLENGY